jgi:Ca2+-binding RTX toxin-like protein
MDGGAGADTFVFRSLTTMGRDRIDNYSVAVDKLELVNYTALNITMVNNMSGVFLYTNDGGSVFVNGVTAAQLETTITYAVA